MDLTMIGNVIAGIVIIFLALGAYRTYKHIRKPKTPKVSMHVSGGANMPEQDPNKKEVTKE